MPVILRNNTPQAIQTTVIVKGVATQINIAGGKQSKPCDELTPLASALVASKKLKVLQVPEASKPEPKQALPQSEPTTPVASKASSKAKE